MIKLRKKRGSIVVNGEQVSGTDIEILGNAVYVDGKKVSEPQKIHIQVIGEVEDITINGRVERIKTTSGEITCHGNIGYAETISGVISCNKAENVKTVSGDVLTVTSE